MLRRTPRRNATARSASRAAAGVLAAAALAAVTVAGCAASASQPPAALPAAGSAAPQTSSAPAVAVLPADAPKFAIPSDLHLVVEADSTGNAAKDSVLLDAAYQFYGFVEAISTGNTKDANFRQWTTGNAYAGLSQSVSTWKSRGERLTGTDRVYKRTVTMSADGSQAAYSACEDSSQAYPLKVGSGRHDTNTAGRGNYTLWQGTFTKRASGGWVLSLIFTKPGASQCVVD
ncbi:hypothetical protein KGA66_27270 [Actinocrinis puniceicyclus]|uniref:Lipoprotein n=1 Tax=Actinocrinis puniceicyclus TaxID=977794 RepID=A0A8J7WVR1_9ACTN|nr:hypothetical protein [Actinocrinis puniceicyclus]MBS2966767.1 hypothetical protein [Actinocrinis puniceicyclus]